MPNVTFWRSWVQTGIAATGRETPTAMFADCRNPSGDSAEPPSGYGWRDAIQKGQERRCSHRHRGRRPRNSLRHVRRLTGPIRGRRTAVRTRGWRCAMLVACCAMQRSDDGSFARCAGDAGLKTGAPGIAATGRETPTAMCADCRNPSGDDAEPSGGGGTPSRRGRSAGLQTGIAAAGRETPTAMFARLPEPVRGRRRTTQWVWVALRHACCLLRHAAK